MAKVFREVVELEKVVPGGQTLGVLADGRKVFVWGGLPGERVEVEVYKVRKSYAEASVVKVITPSDKRVAPRDECYLSTSPWQVYDFRYENELKGELVVEAFRQEGLALRDVYAGSEQAIMTDGNDYGYRNKMEYSLWYDNDLRKIFLAFHRRGSHQKMPITQSSIERPEIFAEARRIVDDLNARGEEARKYQSLVVRCNQQGEVSSALFENGKPHPKMKNLEDEILGRKFSYSPNGFFQINLPVYEMALEEIKLYITTDKVVDMYAGVGTIGLSVAADKNLVLVETNASCFEEMRVNIPVNSSAVTPVIAKAEEALDYITNDSTLIVDPPRAGLDNKVIEHILDIRPPRLIYLSCNPTTQARDIAKLLTKYKIIHAQAFNFFPRTPHIENLVVLEELML